MAKPTDISPVAVTLYFLPTTLRVPLKFGAETVENLSVARVKMEVRDATGRTAVGWGETPLSASWVWPSALGYEERERVLQQFCRELAGAWAHFEGSGHPMEIGHDFEKTLAAQLEKFNEGREEPVPLLAALVCCASFDLALHDAFGVLHGVPTYSTYNAQYMNRDLAAMLEPASPAVSFEGLYPEDFFTPRRDQLAAWHLVGGKDPIREDELTGEEIVDEYPILLRDWIRADQLKCLKIKLRGNDQEWDYQRLIDVGMISMQEGVDWLTADFNCLVHEPDYVNEILDRLLDQYPRIYGMLLYIEQPFPYDLEEHRIDVHSVSARKPLFMDESAHNWELVRLGRELGWSGVALKTCKTQTGALLSLCWAKAHGMTLMVQDLTNPMLSQVTHALLAAHAGTIMGVETNSMQFYPAASRAEEIVHPGLFKRRDGGIDLGTVRGPGFGYRIDEIVRELPAPECEVRCGAKK